MARFVDAIDLPTPARSAFDYLADFSRTVEWDPGVVETERLDEGPPRVGSRFRVVVSFLGRRLPLVYEITELVPGRRVVLEGGDESLRSVDTIDVIERDGGCRVIYDAQLELAGWRAVADPALHVAFQVIGRKASDGLRRAFSGSEGGERRARVA